jgi:hypothetical protein
MAKRRFARATKFIIVTALAVASGLPSVAKAQAAPERGSIVCRPAEAGERANSNVQCTPLVCEPANVDRFPVPAPLPQTNVSPGQAWNKRTQGGLRRQPYPYPGFDGNPND